MTLYIPGARRISSIVSPPDFLSPLSQFRKKGRKVLLGYNALHALSILVYNKPSAGRIASACWIPTFMTWDLVLDASVVILISERWFLAIDHIEQLAAVSSHKTFQFIIDVLSLAEVTNLSTVIKLCINPQVVHRQILISLSSSFIGTDQWSPWDFPTSDVIIQTTDHMEL